MRSRLVGKAQLCQERARLCRALAGHRHCEQSKRGEYRRMAQHWDALAEHFRLAEEVSGFLEWNARRLEPPSAFEEEAPCKISA